MLSTPQFKKLTTFLRAMAGHGPSLDQIVAEGQSAGFGSDQHFLSLPAPVSTSLEDTWVLVEENDIPLEGGRYWIDYLVFFTGDEQNRDYQIRALVNDVPTGDVISKELKDIDDSIEYNTFNQFDFPAGTINLKLEMFIPGGGGVPGMTVTRYRVRIYKIGPTPA